MTTDTKQRIFAYIEQNKQATARELVLYFDISEVMVFRHLKDLLSQGRIQKIGRPPRVFYQIADMPRMVSLPDPLFEWALRDKVDKEYLYVRPDGRIIEGMDGLRDWCLSHNLPFEKTVGEYYATLGKYEQFKNGEGLIDGMSKLKQTFEDVALDKLFYLSFYSIERFGKTRLGALLLYAKQSQSRKLIREIVKDVRNSVMKIIEKEKIDAVGFIPPTVVRKVQFQKEFEKMLALSLPKIDLVKATNDIAVPQKSLNKLVERVSNAENSIFVTGANKYRNILLIDDAVGSGATLNVTAKKIKERGLVTGNIIGLALTGSFNGFDVINEV